MTRILDYSEQEHDSAWRQVRQGYSTWQPRKFAGRSRKERKRAACTLTRGEAARCKIPRKGPRAVVVGVAENAVRAVEVVEGPVAARASLFESVRLPSLGAACPGHGVYVGGGFCFPPRFARRVLLLMCRESLACVARAHRVRATMSIRRFHVDDSVHRLRPMVVPAPG